jgi:hypothetical protein
MRLSRATSVRVLILPFGSFSCLLSRVLCNTSSVQPLPSYYEQTERHRSTAPDASGRRRVTKGRVTKRVENHADWAERGSVSFEHEMRSVADLPNCSTSVTHM